MDDYTAVVTREGDYWLASVEGMAGGHTYGRSLPALLRHLEEVIILGADLPDDARPEFQLRFDVEDEVIMAAAAVAVAREQLARSQARVSADTERYVRELLEGHHVSVRDAATILGITPGRVSQLRRQSPGA